MERQNKGEDDLVVYVHKYEAQIVIISINMFCICSASLDCIFASTRLEKIFSVDVCSILIHRLVDDTSITIYFAKFVLDFRSIYTPYVADSRRT